MSWSIQYQDDDNVLMKHSDGTLVALADLHTSGPRAVQMHGGPSKPPTPPALPTPPTPGKPPGK